MIDEIWLDENGLMKRPRFTDGCVRRRAAEMALPQVKGWLGVRGGKQDKELVEQLMKVLKSGGAGFEVCQDLEAMGWSPNAYLVEILDEDYLGDARDEMVSQWVVCLGVKLELPIGATVVTHRGPGVVMGTDENLAQYIVHIEGMPPDRKLICDAEDVKSAAAAVAA